eukprot:TRINITY_DN59033_c0_g1_i1.p3 TRINITY_DN59033_c0_g1~~TRINITY_DN59033_c0_g1_i1.p3  ORF type:complete len:201 (-),score=47.51 TRINITY_DN59033_c0_g1_i1:21-623(-)
MIAGKRVLALVPARAGSKGLPGKNIKPFCGKPLLLWSVEHGLASSYVDSVVVSTDSREFAEIAKKGGAEVPFIRPEHLASDTAASIDVMLHTVDFLEARGDLYDILVLLEPTSPLRKPEDIDKALEVLCSHPHAESIVAISLTEAQHPVFLTVSYTHLTLPTILLVQISVVAVSLKKKKKKKREKRTKNAKHKEEESKTK